MFMDILVIFIILWVAAAFVTSMLAVLLNPVKAAEEDVKHYTRKKDLQ